MKNKMLFLGLFILMISLSSCVKNNVISISLAGDGSVIEYKIGETNLADYQLEVVYENGDTMLIPMTEDMIDSLDVFNQVGLEEVTVTYNNAITVITFKTYETDLDLKLLNIYANALLSNIIDATYEEWLDSIRGEDGVGIENVEVNTLGHLIITLTDDSLIDAGMIVSEASNIELDTLNGYIVWRYVGETEWNDLLLTSELTGDTGVGIDNITIVEGTIHVEYTDGTSQDLDNLYNYHIVNFYNLDGFIISSQLIKDGEDAVDVTLPEKDGYNVTAWDTVYLNVQENLNIHPVFTTLQNTIEFSGDSVSQLPIENISYGESVILPVPEQLGYRFIGWFNGTDENSAQVFNDTVIIDSMTLYARWEKASYSIMFNTLSGEEVPPLEITYLDSIPTLQEITHGTKIFGGWYTSMDFTDKFSLQRMPAEDIIVYAKWIEYEYTVHENYGMSYVSIDKLNTQYDDIFIPDYIEGFPVKMISKEAFRYGRFKHIELPRHLMWIDDYAFADNAYLVELGTTDSLMGYGIGVFLNCTALSHVELSPETTVIFNSMFENTPMLGSLLIPSNVTHIMDYAFSKSGIEEINFPAKLLYIGDYAFSETSIHHANIPIGVQIIEEGAFYSCPNLSEAYIPVSVIAIGDKAYANNPLLTEFVLADYHMFFLLYDSGLYLYDSIDPSSDYKLIAYPAGKVDSNVDIHTNTSLISPNVFEGASHIQTVTMPNSLIGNFGLIFKGTSSLQGIYLASNTRPQVLDVLDGVLYSSDFTVLYKYPDAKTDTSYTVNSNTITINDAAFYGASNLTTVILPEGLVNIGSEAFMNTENISAINIPTTLENIETMAFYNSNSITSFVLTSTVESISYMAFAEMDALTSIRFEGVGYVGGSVLYNCDSLTDLFLNAVTFYPDALNGIRNLQNFELVSGTLYAGIEDDVIYAKDMITLYRYGDWLTSASFTTPDNITMLGGSSFGTNEYLTSLTLSSNLENIFQTSLSQLPNLEELIILRESSLSMYDLSEILNHDMQHVTIYVTASSYDDYINDPNNSEFIDQIDVIPS